MRILRIALLLAIIAPWLRAQQKPVERGYPLNPDGFVRMHNLVGTVRVIGWERDSLAITATLRPGMQLFSGGGRESAKFGVGGDQTSAAESADFVVRLPARARIAIRGAATDVDVSAFAGEIDVSTTSGRVRIQGTPREVKAETMNGDLEIIASPAYLRGKTASGRITWTGSSEDVGLSSVSGQVLINGGKVTRGLFETIDGDIRFTGGVTRTADVVFDTHGGEVVLVFARDTGAELVVNAPATDLFGRKTVRAPLGKGEVTKGETTYGKSGPVYASVGKPGAAAPTITVRSFKGRVTATMQ